MRIDELSVQQDCESALDSKSGFTEQNELIPWPMQENFYDPEKASNSGASHVLSQPSTVPIPRTMPCRDSGLPHETRNSMGTSGNVLESLPAREGPSSALFDNSLNLASSFCGLGQATTVNIMKEGRRGRCNPSFSFLFVFSFFFVTSRSCLFVFALFFIAFH